MGKILNYFVLFLALSGLASATERCGVDDKTLDRSKRFALNNSPHSSKSITYKITQYTNQLSHQDVDDVILRAFNMWTEHTDLKFTQMQPEEKADINIRFAAYEHGDGYPFDGKGNVLAHATRDYVHFDDDETWKAKADDEGTSLLKVAVHEIGHALGLSHSHEGESIMFFAHSGDNEHEFKLHDDDIQGIQEIYGGKTVRPVFDENLCKDPTMDTMFSTPDGKVYVFKKDKYYELEGTVIKDGPKPISGKWSGLPSDIDAAFSKGDKTYFFKNDKYWRFTGDQMDADYPAEFRAKLGWMPDNIDDATVGQDGKIYFFNLNKFYRIDDFNEHSNAVTEGNIADEFPNIPNHIEAVHFHPSWQLTFFFKIDKFYAFGAGPAYEIPTTSYFFGCSRN